jgi:hypothetical protein
MRIFPAMMMTEISKISWSHGSKTFVSGRNSLIHIQILLGIVGGMTELDKRNTYDDLAMSDE